MKRVTIIVFLFCIPYLCFSQLKVSFAEDTVTRVRLKNGDYTSDLKLNVNGTYSGNDSNDINLEIFSGTPTIFKLIGPALKPNAGTSQMIFPFTLLRGENPNNDTAHVGIALSYFSGTTYSVDTIVVRVVNETQKQDESDDGYHNKLTFLNAFNFDFYGKLNSNYVGVFNIYEPARSRGKKDSTIKLFGFPTKWTRTESRAAMYKRKYGFNTGIMKINYGLGTSTDTTNRHRLEDIKMSVLDSVVPGKKYLRQYNKYATTSSNSVWSFYVQPLALINPLGTTGTKTRVYLHSHLELLVSKLITKTSISNVAQDTAVIPNPVPTGMVLRTRAADGTTVTTTTTKYNGYFGLGPTFDISLTKTSSIFLQATIGKTTSNPEIYSVPDIKLSEMSREPRKWQGFYLIRASFSMKLSEASNLVVAQDIRGLLPRYNPLYATFVGLNVKVEELLKFIKD